MSSTDILIVGCPAISRQVYAFLSDSHFVVHHLSDEQAVRTFLLQRRPAVVLIHARDATHTTQLLTQLHSIPTLRGVALLLATPPARLDHITNACYDDYVWYPPEPATIIHKLQLWLRLTLDEPPPGAWLPVLQYQLQRARQMCTQGDFGGAKSLLEDIWQLLVSMPDQQALAWQVAKLIAKIKSLMSWGQAPRLMAEFAEVQFHPPVLPVTGSEAQPLGSESASALGSESASAKGGLGSILSSIMPNAPNATTAGKEKSYALRPAQWLVQNESSQVLTPGQDLAQDESSQVRIDKRGKQAPRTSPPPSDHCDSADMSRARTPQPCATPVGPGQGHSPVNGHREEQGRAADQSPVPVTQQNMKIRFKKRDLSFVTAVLKRHLVTPSQLVQCISQQKQLEQRGGRISLCDIMLQNGVVQLEDLREILAGFTLLQSECWQCGRQFQSLQRVVPQQPPACPCCGAPPAKTRPRGSRQAASKQGPLPLQGGPQFRESSSQELEIITNPCLPDVASLVQRARAWYTRKKPRQAIFWYSRALDIQPDYLPAYIGRSSAYLDTQEYLQALTDADKALDLDPSSNQALCNRGVARYYCHYFSEAIADMTTLIHCERFPFTSYSTRGKAFFQQKEYHKAIADLTAALKIRPTYVKGYIYRGRAYALLGEDELAVQDLQKALRLDPHCPVEKLLEVSQMRLVTQKIKASSRSRSPSDSPPKMLDLPEQVQGQSPPS